MKSKTVLELLILLIIVLNTADAVLTSIGVYRLEGVDEGNSMVRSFVQDVKLFVTIKMVLLTTLFLLFFSYLFRHRVIFDKLWESEVAVGAACALVLFYTFIVVRNLIIIYGF